MTVWGCSYFIYKLPVKFFTLFISRIQRTERISQCGQAFTAVRITGSCRCEYTIYCSINFWPCFFISLLQRCCLRIPLMFQIISTCFGSIIFLVGLPPHSVLVSYATLDRMEKQCCSFITDGEELKNNLSFLRRSTQCSIVFPSPQGQVPSGWLVYTSGSAA